MPKPGLKKKTKPPKWRVAAREIEGTFHGYAATWDRVPPFQFQQGAFSKSISERSRDIPVMIKHLRDGADVFEQVGILTGAHEDEIGLAVSGRYYRDELSQAIREKVNSGAPRHFSVGFEELQARDEDGIHITTEARLVEVTITNNPQNPHAKILDSRENAGQPDPLSNKGAGDTEKRWLSMAQMRLDLLELVP